MSKFDSIYKSIQEDIVKFISSNGERIKLRDLEEGELYDFTDLESSLADYVNEYDGDNYQELLEETELPEIIGDILKFNTYVFLGDEFLEDNEDKVEDCLDTILGLLEY